MNAIVIVLVLAVTIEAVIDVIKGWVPEGAHLPSVLWPIVSAALGVALCIVAGVDILALAGVSLAVPLIGQVLTGVLISKSSNFIYDFWERVKGAGGAGGDGQIG